jgi:hypothetical protein
MSEELKRAIKNANKVYVYFRVTQDDETHIEVTKKSVIEMCNRLHNSDIIFSTQAEGEKYNIILGW